jgi:hypothetical protein
MNEYFDFNDMLYLVFKIALCGGIVFTLRHFFGDVTAGWFVLFIERYPETALVPEKVKDGE